MKLKETIKNIKRGINDFWHEIDSNPERIVAFPAHLPDCSRTTPLKVETDLKAHPMGWSSTVELIVTRKSCQECGGVMSLK